MKKVFFFLFLQKLRKNGRVFWLTGWEAMKLHECLGEGNPCNRIVADFCVVGQKVAKKTKKRTNGENVILWQGPNYSDAQIMSQRKRK